MTGKMLICYGSRYGTTTEVVQEMKKTAEELGATTETVFLKKEKLPATLHEYNLKVIGSGIATGKWTNEPLDFIKNNIEELGRQKTALFVVCGSKYSIILCHTCWS